MKIEIDNLDKTYNKCTTTGSIKEKNAIDIELIRSLKDIAEQGLSFTKEKSKGLPKDSKNWTFVFRDYYESLRGFIEAYLLTDKITSENHQCKNAYRCFKHPELDLNWNFLETARLKRNHINYRGQSLKYEDWIKLKINFDLHINKLKEEIEKKLEEDSLDK